MERKQTLIWVIVAMALVLGYMQLLPVLYEKYPDLKPKDPATTALNPTPATQPGPATGPGTTQPATAGATSAPGAAPTTGLRVLAAAEGEAKPWALGSDQYRDPTYALRLALSPHGAGVQSVTLNSFHRTVEDKDLYTFQQPLAGHENATRALATQWVSVNGGPRLDLSGVSWALRESSATSATYSLTLAQGDQPVVRLDKRYDIFPRSNPNLGYEVTVTQGFENLSGEPVTVKAGMAGPLPPPSEMPGQQPQVVASYWDRSILQLKHLPFAGFVEDKTTQDLTRDDKKQPLAWAGHISEYFDALMLPVGTGPGALAPGLERVVAQAFDVTPNDKRADNVLLTVETTAFALTPAAGPATTQPAAAAAAAAVPFSVYLGPKWRDVLNVDYYEASPRRYDATLAPPQGWWCMSICTFQWLINVLVWMLKGFHFVAFRDWGLAIICLVLVVRALLHPITKRSQVHMMRLGKLGPEAEALKKKYKDQPDELNKAMMQLYKQQGMTPVLGCLPMFLQMPIWIALYAALQSTFELRHAPFLHFFGIPFTWINDLAQPDRLIAFSTPLSLPFGWKMYGINLLPLLLGVVFFLQQKFTPKPPTMTPEQEQQQKMMMWMTTLMFPLFLYGGPSGLNLYIFTSTAFGIVESKRIRKHIKEREEAEKANKVIVDAKPTRGARRRDRDRAERQPEPPKKGLMAWLADLQAKAEQVRREQQRRGNR